MKFSSVLFGLVSVQVALAHPEGSIAGLNLRRSNKISGYPISDMQYSGEHGGNSVQFNGTVESIHAQIQGNNSSFKSPRSTGVSTKLAARNKNGLLCCPVAGQDWLSADHDSIISGIGYLESLPGRCGVNSFSCARISCSYDSAIYLCNDNSYFINPSCQYLATYAVEILNTCGPCGQEFDSDHYNIIVRGDGC